jgi:translation initiation factor 1
MNNIVYSTDPDWKENCDRCGKSLEDCSCKESNTALPPIQTVYIKIDKKGRGGKTVSLITNVKGDLKSLQKEIQKKCASGGAVKNGNIEIQGDHLRKMREILEKKGFKVKQVGG